MECQNFSNEFENEKHADDDLHCEGCGKKIPYCHGDTDYCNECEKWINEGYKKNAKGEWERKKKSFADMEEEYLDDYD